MPTKKFFDRNTVDDVRSAHAAVIDAHRTTSYALYLGHDGERRWCCADNQQSVMVLGPPRSGKTSSLVVPNVLCANGAVVSTSTKADVLLATFEARRRLGRCGLFDPTGGAPPTPDVTPIRWSPLQSCGSWDGAMSMARLLVDVGTTTGVAGNFGEHSHWSERARALLAPLLHAAALDGAPMRQVMSWVDRRRSLDARNLLAASSEPGARLADDLLCGVEATDTRELSGIWSTASGALSGFRSEGALAVTDRPDFDVDRFVRSADTLYITAPAHRQALVAPMVVALVDRVCMATYARHGEALRSTGSVRDDPPVLLALDELANIAPLPGLPAMLSEGGGQGLVTLACFQDLSQARHRWPGQADGFPSLFGTTVVLPGIGDISTLEALSALAGDEEVATRTVSVGRSPSGQPLVDMVDGGRLQFGQSATSQQRRRLPPDVIARGVPGLALGFDKRNQPGWITLTPAHRTAPWSALIEAARRRALDQGQPDSRTLGR